jgi:hypothetical protein
VAETANAAARVDIIQFIGAGLRLLKKPGTSSVKHEG